MYWFGRTFASPSHQGSRGEEQKAEGWSQSPRGGLWYRLPDPRLNSRAGGREERRKKGVQATEELWASLF